VTRRLLTEGPLSPAQAALVAELAEAARQADGVAPLSEHALLHARHPAPAGRATDDSATDDSADDDSATDNMATDNMADGPPARDLLLISGQAAAGYAHLDFPEDAGSGDLSGELVVHPAHRRRGHASMLISALADGAGERGIRLWAHGDLPAAAGLARATGFTRVRSLWQMRRALAGPGAALPEPSFPAGVTVRAFIPGQDEEAWLEVNARAFAHHPEQGAWTRADLELREAEPWFDPAGFFLAERDGRLAGFHWTKVHAAGPDSTPGKQVPEGEVYVVGVDPGQQAGGLGRALTLAGLRYLADRGLAHVMLYVDEENSAATRLYTALGFTRSSTDVMYRHP
jgi:mycothiol synthase